MEENAGNVLNQELQKAVDNKWTYSKHENEKGYRRKNWIVPCKKGYVLVLQYHWHLQKLML